MVKPWWRFAPDSGDALAPTGLRRQLDEIGRSVDWQRFDKFLRWIDPRGRHSGGFAPIVVFRALLIQQWYALMAVEYEFCLTDSISCRRFVGLRDDEPPPCSETVTRFRRLLAERGVAVEMYGELERQLAALGLPDLAAFGPGRGAADDYAAEPPRLRAVQPLGPPEWTEIEAMLLAFWEGRRGDRRMPDLTDVKLSEIPGLQPDVVLIRVLPETEDFRYEYVGGRVVEGNAGDPTGATINEKVEQNLRSYGHRGLQSELSAVFSGAVRRRRPASTSTYFVNAGLRKCEIWMTVTPLANPGDGAVGMLLGAALIKPILLN